jgi:hypothetical protein
MPAVLARWTLGCATATLLGCASASSDPTPAPAPTPAASRGPSTSTRLGIPPGHLPPPGSCRVWVPGTPPGHQAKAGPCAALLRSAPPGSWLVYRPSTDRKVVHVREIDSKRAGVVVRVRVFDVATGMAVRETAP